MMMRRVLGSLAALLSAMITLSAQAPGPQKAAAAKPAAAKPATAPSGASGVTFTDVTKAAGITFKHNNGAFGKKYLPETMGSGVVFVDFDGDGFADLFYVNSKNWPDHPGAKSYPALYHNNRNGTFSDVTKQAGLAIELYGFGATAADYDNDGHVDLFVTALGGNHLFHNNGNGTFSDATARAGVGASAFSTSAAWFDYDKDGFVDLVVLNYVQWSAEKDLFCTLDGKTKSYCTPESYKGESPILYHNKHDGTFEDVTKAAGLYDPASKAMGVALFDYNGDGWLDLFVANDTQPNRLYRNTGKGSFVDEAVASGVAFNEAGVARAGMGVDAADYDRSGRESLIIGNFSNEMMALYHNEGTNLFIDEAPTATIGQASLLSLTFGCFFFDFDNDGLLDVFAANGHVADDINRVQPKVTYAQTPHLFHNLGNKRFEVASGNAGLQERLVARGAAYADFDNDGDLDIAIATNNGPARLLRNDGGNRGNALRVALVGAKSNRSAIGARITASLDGGATTRAMVKSGSSYLSQSELPVTFGLGRAAKVAALEIQWPSGQLEKIPATDANQTITVEEGRGITKRTPFQKPGPAPATASASGSASH